MMMDNTELRPGGEPSPRDSEGEAKREELSSAPLERAPDEETGFERTLRRERAGVGARRAFSAPSGGVDEPDDEPPPSLPDVEIAGLIGRGGQGVVYRARQTYLERDVAVKILPRSADADFEQRFRREARILAGLNDAHIVGCYQAGVSDDGRCYLVMELIDGPDLAKWIEAHGRLDVRDALTLTRDIAKALSHAHDVGIIHRDVKPQNVLLQTNAAAGGRFAFRAKLADLGLARGGAGELALTQITAPGSIMGTPSTMAPEQFDDAAKVDFRADIYGLGCVLYHALVGRCAYSGQTLGQVIRRKSSSSPPDPTKENKDVPSSVARLVQRMLAAEPADRPTSYAELLREIEFELELLDRPPLRTRVAPLARPAFVAALGIAFVVALVMHFTGTSSEGTDAASLPRAANASVEADSGPTPTAGDASGVDGADAPAATSEAKPSDEVELPRDAALTPATIWAPFEAWTALEDLLAVDGWEHRQPENRMVWGCVEGDLASVQANSPSGPSSATRRLPAGAWTFRGELGASRAFGWDDVEPRAGVRLVVDRGHAFEWEASAGQSPLVLRWRWSKLGDDGRWTFDASRPNDERVLTTPNVRFVCESDAGSLALSLELGADAARVELTRQPTDHAPARLDLFVEGGMGLWSDFEFRGR